MYGCYRFFFRDSLGISRKVDYSEVVYILSFEFLCFVLFVSICLKLNEWIGIYVMIFLKLIFCMFSVKFRVLLKDDMK